MSGLRDLPAVLVTAGRLILRHWPMLLTLALAGVAVRNAALWAAVVVSDWNSWVGQLFLVLTPLGYLLPLIAMLHLMRESLPRLRAVGEMEGPVAPTEGRPRRLVDVAASMLVPFLAVYVSYGLMEQDRLRFTNQAAFEEFNSAGLGGPGPDFGGRVGIYSLQVMVMIVAIAWVLRWALGLAERKTSFLALAFVGALTEVYYTGQVARQWTGAKNLTSNWLDDRVVVHAVQSRYEAAVDQLGPFANPIERMTSFVFGLIGSLDAVVIVPMAWLTVGAVVLGHKLSPPPVRGPRAGRVGVVRRVGGSLFADIRERWSAFWGGLRLLFTAGLLPMLAFCLVFLVVLRVPLLFSHLWRWMAGPTDTTTWLAFSAWETGLGLALSMALLAPLLAAAIEWLVAPKVTASAGTARTPDGRSRATLR